MRKLLPVITLLVFILMLYVNYLSGTGQINSISAGAVSGKYPTLFTPAGFTFSIWGLIYLFGFIFIVQLFIMSFGNVDIKMISSLSVYYILSCLLNISWIFAWHYEKLGVSEILMIGLLVTLILLYQKVSEKPYSSIWKYVFTYTPISLYLGWICIATVANTSVWFTSLNWDGSPLSERFWASLMIIIAALINLVILVKKRDIFFALVYLWAAYGIIVARSGDMSDAGIWVSRTAIAGMVMVLLGIFYARFVRIEKT